MSNLDAVIGIFSDDTEKAAEFLQRYEKEHDQLGITEAVAIVNEHEKKPNVTYMGTSKKKGAGVGIVTGALVGLVGGPVGVVVGGALGAFGGASAVAASHIGVSKNLIENVEDKMPENGSAILVLVEPASSHLIINDLSRAEATIVNETITSEQFDKASLISPSSGIAES